MRPRVIMFCTCCESQLEFSEATLNGTSRYFVYSAVISYFCIVMRRRTKQKKSPLKGDEIRFIRGTYIGCTGWLDTANKSKRKSKLIWVVVNDEDYDEEVKLL